jgi:hypothetical protein
LEKAIVNSHTVAIVLEDFLKLMIPGNKCETSHLEANCKSYEAETYWARVIHTQADLFSSRCEKTHITVKPKSHWFNNNTLLPGLRSRCHEMGILSMQHACRITPCRHIL